MSAHNQQEPNIFGESFDNAIKFGLFEEREVLVVERVFVIETEVVMRAIKGYGAR